MALVLKVIHFTAWLFVARPEQHISLFFCPGSFFINVGPKVSAYMKHNNFYHHRKRNDQPSGVESKKKTPNGPTPSTRGEKRRTFLPGQLTVPPPCESHVNRNQPGKKRLSGTRSSSSVCGIKMDHRRNLPPPPPPRPPSWSQQKKKQHLTTLCLFIRPVRYPVPVRNHRTIPTGWKQAAGKG